MVISVEAEKAFDKNSTPLRDKNISWTRHSWEHPEVGKGHVQKPTALIVQYDEQLKAFPPTQEQDKDTHSSPHLIDTVIEVLARVIRQEKASRLDGKK